MIVYILSGDGMAGQIGGMRRDDRWMMWRAEVDTELCVSGGVSQLSWSGGSRRPSAYCCASAECVAGGERARPRHHVDPADLMQLIPRVMCVRETAAETMHVARGVGERRPPCPRGTAVFRAVRLELL